MLTVADMTGAVAIRALVDVMLADGRKWLCAGDVVNVSPEEAQRLSVEYERGTFEVLPERKPVTCSARRGDNLWQWGVK